MAALFDRHRPDPPTATVIALLASVNGLGAAFSLNERGWRWVHDRANEIASGCWVDEADLADVNLAGHHRRGAGGTGPSACSRSPSRSAASSMPTDIRTRSSGTSSCEPAVEGVGHRARMLDQRLHPAQRFGEDENLCARTQVAGGLRAAAHPNGDHAAESAHLPGGDVVAGMARQARVEHLADRGVVGQERGEDGGVLAVPLHPQLERLEAAHGQVGVERAGDRTRAVLQETEPGVEFLVIGHQRAADHVGVPTDVLGRRVQNDVGAQRQRLLQRRRGEGVVHQHLYPEVPASRRWPGCPAIDSSGLVGVSTQISRVWPVIAVRTASRSASGTGVVHTPLPEDLVDEPEGAAVGVVGDDDVVARRNTSAARSRRPPFPMRRPARRFRPRQRRAPPPVRNGSVAGARRTEAAAQTTDPVPLEGAAGVDRALTAPVPGRR